jgi:hypothetical protein
VYRGGVYVAKKYPVTTFLYAFGMVMMLCATGMSLPSFILCIANTS